MNSMVGCFCYAVKDTKKRITFHGSLENEDLKLIFHTSAEHNGNRINIKIIPKLKIEIRHLSVKTNVGISLSDTVFLNGYQSWTESREFSLNERIPPLNILINSFMNPYGDYSFIGFPKNNLHSWTYTYIRKQNKIVLYGSLSEASGFTVFAYHGKRALRISKDCAGLIIDSEYKAFDIFIIKGEEKYVFDQYFAAMNLPKPKAAAYTGWTSWYSYFSGITEEIIIENLNAFKDRNIPLDIFQIDDGYEEYVGDWLDINKKFPGGMKNLSDKIKSCGYKSGLWIAPFICEEKSELFKNHRDWIVRKAGNNSNWSSPFYTLDFYNMEVRQYLKTVFDVVLKVWNFDLVKLDFLYTAVMTERKDKTRGQVMYEALKFLREIIGDKLILGCGVQLGSAFGLVDFCRVGADASDSWENNLYKFFGCRERSSALTCMTSTIGRRHLNMHAFINDPDVFILRNKNNKLTKHQRFTCFIINLLFGGVLFTSDNIGEYTEEEMIIYDHIFRFKEKNINRVETAELLKVFFTSQSKEYLTLCNLKNRKAFYDLKGGNYSIFSDKPVSKDNILALEPYESVLLCRE